MDMISKSMKHINIVFVLFGFSVPPWSLVNANTGNGKESGFIDQVPHTCTGHLTSYILSIFMITSRAKEFITIFQTWKQIQRY